MAACKVKSHSFKKAVLHRIFALNLDRFPIAWLTVYKTDKLSLLIRFLFENVDIFSWLTLQNGFDLVVFDTFVMSFVSDGALLWNWQ